MNAAHVTTIGDLRTAVDGGTLTELLADVGQGFRVVFGHNPSDEELAIWSVSLPAFIRVLPRSLDPIPVMIELRMPIGNERADLVLLGGQSEQRAVVVELKHWTGKVQAYEVSPNLVLLGGDGGMLRPHPGYQAAGCTSSEPSGPFGRLRKSHSRLVVMVMPRADSPACAGPASRV